MKPKSIRSADETVNTWAAAVSARDIGSIMACYADPLLVFDVVGPLQRRGTALYRKAWENEFLPWHGGKGRFELRELSVHAGDDLAFATALLDCGGIENARAVEYTLRLTLGLNRTTEGWRIVHEHNSQPTPFDQALET